MCVWLPHWPLQRICLVQPELKGRPVVLYGSIRSGSTSGRSADWQVRHCSGAAVKMGVGPGMPLAEAQALLERSVRGAHFTRHDAQADRKNLQLLAGWCSRYSPLVGMEEDHEPSALFFDISGCAHLFGGETGMAEQVIRDFERAGYLARLAVADTVGAAWAAVRFVRRGAPCPEFGARSQPADLRPVIVPAGRQSDLLRELPVAALRLPPEVVETLHELGIREIGPLQGLPRSSLPARFGACVLERLDQALGLAAEPIVSVPPAEPIEANWSFEEPTADRRALESVLKGLVGEIAETLAARQEGAQKLVCRLFCAGKEPVRLTVGALHPTAAAEHLCELVRLQLERVALAGEVLAVEVEVVSSGPLESHQHELFDAGVNRDGERQLALLLDRLSSRLGENSVLRPRLFPDPQPEYASRLAPAHQPLMGQVQPNARTSKFSGPVPDRLATSVAARPLCLKSRPVPIEVVSVVPDGPPIRFRWRAAEHVVERRWGPERIEAGWWRGSHVQRDYYRIETATGQRFWVFRQNDTGKWFLHGTFE